MDRAQIPGRVIVTSRAYERIAAAVSAEALGVPRRAASARVRDDAGRIAAEVSAGARVGGESILARAARTREVVAARLTDLTGASVSDVRIHLTHHIDDDRRTS